MRLKIRAKLTILFLGVAALPLLLAMLVTLGRIQGVQTRQSLELQGKIAEAAAKEVADFLSLQFGLLDNTGAISPEFSADPKSQALFLERILFSGESLVELAVTDAQGKEVSRVHRLFFITEEDYVDRSQTPEFLAVKANERYIGPLLIELGRPFFFIGKAIRGGQGELNGAIFAKVDARIMQEVVSEISAVGTKGRAYIVNDEGTIIGHPDVSQILAERDFSDIPIVRDTIDGKTDSSSFISPYRNELGQEVLGAIREIRLEFGGRLPGTLAPGWFVVAEEPSSMALEAAIQTARFGWLVFAAVAALAVFISVFFASRIVRPVEQLNDAYRKLSAGDLNHRVYIQTKDEIEDLGKGFNQMAQSLTQSIKALEESKQVLEVKVEARTHELKELAESLERKVKERTKELQERLAELERFHKVTVGRELKMVELKQEIARLKKALEKKR